MATDGNQLEVLQNIAINNQLSPNIYSSNNTSHKENQAILNHPFYQNLPKNKKEILKERKIVPDQKGVSNRYVNHNRSRKDNGQDNSFHTISSVSLQNEVSAATDMQYEDFFDTNQRKGNINSSKIY